MTDPTASFKEISHQNCLYWEKLSNQEKIDHAASDMIANAYFYLGELEKGKEVSSLHSRYSENMIFERSSESYRIYSLFIAGLYASLAQEQERAERLWLQLIDRRQNFFPKKEVLRWKKAEVWVYEAYALTKLGRYSEVSEPARQGKKAIRQGKVLIDDPQQERSLEYGLPDVLFALTDYFLKPTSARQQKAQAELLRYKEENFKYGKLGYNVIFDLQFSYPEVFTPVLPGPEPELD